MKAVRRLLVDVAPLRQSRDYRFIFAGQLVSMVGRQLTIVAGSLQVFLLTESSFAVGLLSVAQLGPLIVCSLIGGAIADAYDRRKVLIWAQVGLALTSVGLAVNASMASPALWPVFVCTALSAGLSGIDAPTRSASMPALVGLELIPAAAALNQISFHVATIVGPSLAGLVIANVSIAAAYWVDVATFVVALVSVLLVRPLVPEGGGTRAGMRSIREGLGYLRQQRALQGTFLIDINAMLFGMPRALFPELGLTQFGGGAQTVGLLYAAIGVGAFLAAATTGWVRRVHRQGRAVIIAVLLWGAAITVFGLADQLWVALEMLALAGAADLVSAVFRTTILQVQVPDRLRGRLNAVNIAVVTGGPRLGDLESGAVSALTSPQFAVTSGGVACMVGAGVIARLIPELGAWRTPAAAVAPDEPAVDADR
jgi:MFS family permease